MKLIESAIKPYIGLDKIKLYDSLRDVENYLNRNKINYTSEVWGSEDETIKNPWTVLFVENCINLYFASNNKLFKIYCIDGFKGSLPNGINLSTNLKDAKIIDSTLRYCDDEEDYESEKGYWIEDSLDNGKVISITVYIREILDNKKFDEGNW